MSNSKNIKTPLVTVGVPSYNRRLTLERTLDSIMNQTYDNLEVLISDNCSIDPEIDILIEDYMQKDSRIRFIKQLENIGPTHNFSYLLNNASGEYFMWLADDDYMSNNYIEEVMNEFAKDDSYSLIGGQGYFVNTEKNLKTKNESMDLNDTSPSKRFVKYLNTVSSNSIFYGIFETKSIAMDYDMHFYGSDWLHVARLAYVSKVKTLKNISVFREDNGVSNKHYTYLQRRRIYYNIYKKFKYDLLNSSLYNDLEDKDFKKLHKEVKKAILTNISIIHVIKKSKINNLKDLIFYVKNKLKFSINS